MAQERNVLEVKFMKGKILVSLQTNLPPSRKNCGTKYSMPSPSLGKHLLISSSADLNIFSKSLKRVQWKFLQRKGFLFKQKENIFLFIDLWLSNNFPTRLVMFFLRGKRYFRLNGSTHHLDYFAIETFPIEIVKVKRG